MSNDSSEEVEHVSLTTCSKEVSRPLSEISFEVTPQRVETPVPDTVERCIPSEVGDTDKKINSSAFQECISPATATSTYKTPFHPPLVPDKPADTSLETVPSDHSSLAFQEEHQKAMSSTPVSERIVADLDDSPHSDAHEEVNISTPSVSTMATNANNNSTGLQATPPSGRKVRADSSQWIASRKETLNQLRAELEEKTANHTPGRRQSHQRQTLAPPLFYEEVQPATPDPVPVHVDVSPEKPVEEEITESTPFASEEFLSPREPPTNEFSGDTSADTDVKVTEVPVANAPRNDTEMIDRNISSISNISPDKNDLVSILAALYGTPSHMARSPSPEKVLNRSGETRSPPPTSPSVPSRSPADRSVVLEKKMRREQKIRDEMKAKELAECTFHPTISPGTRAMIAIQERSKITEMDKGVPPNQTSDGTKKERRELWDSVYNRLYPDELKNAPSQKHQLDQEMDYKLEARKEMFVLRSFAGATYKSETPETAYKTFLSNLFQFDCRTASRADCVAEGVMVETPYCSPMAYALLEESNNKKKLANARRGDLTAPVKEGKEFRIALFDDFLLRQNAFHHRRRKRLHELTKAMTPDFTPSTTEQSSQLVKNCCWSVPKQTTRRRRKRPFS
ncbi:hypothetical protein AGDE_13424 [Angomonas deanei]|uniref:Uncharacterized protein n=1 Tax=Angomonas deanei TaxID=59799 RepID=A0A7G2C906_9TRYP|nr:hypothetical protein AGDE_13424 [Angomonas deanei]CAD2216266.1 hypothetical protein, conserved [Angomonas deanei]|eukprot:EPY22355.1 hypothetical protein AGDE_13424 [Angomonas deanei]